MLSLAHILLGFMKIQMLLIDAILFSDKNQLRFCSTKTKKQIDDMEYWIRWQEKEEGYE